MSLLKLINKAIENKLLETYTSIPGKVYSYEKNLQKAVVKPLPKINFDNYNLNFSETLPEEISYEELNLIHDVPVLQRSGNIGKAYIHIPVKKGDLGMLCFTTRSIDTYLAGKGDHYDVTDDRHHELSDAYFIPGILPFGSAYKVVSNDNIEICNENSIIKIMPDGKFSFSGETSELLDLISSLMDKLSTTTVATLMGPMPLSTSAEIAALKLLLDSIKGG